MIKVKPEINCPYCNEKAQPLKNDLARPRDDSTTRYGCENAHYFAVPTLSVLVKE